MGKVLYVQRANAAEIAALCNIPNVIDRVS
jgi:hypothetical protein